MLKRLKRLLLAAREKTPRQVSPPVPGPQAKEIGKPIAEAAETSPKGGGAESRPGQRPATADVGRSGSGIRRIDPKTDLEALLLATDSDTGTTAGEGRQSGTPREVAEPPPPAHQSGTPPRSNRHGIRIIGTDESLDALLTGTDAANGSSTSEEKAKGTVRQMAGSSVGGKAHSRTDRHGIPLLDRGADLDRLFGSPEKKPDDESEAFTDLLESSLAGETPQSVLRKKQEGAPKPRPLSVRERLKRYPPPQRDLDLHGFRSHQADQRTESFVRTAFQDGYLTLRIIVGKGLHSEDGPVLPHVVENRLRKLKRDHVVLSYRWEGRTQKRSGSLIVYLDAFRLGGP